eukprot:TRINITY_DN16462_c0_g1_i3.p4 TRINITY_DN16462_c0_g1~~TRINITY_DN16462_c0_g1_i3.p4  ORF type:complete len:122 (+),score=18.08 TRINITY_DN16462_c0_g1_i3:1109-1474(+)
MRLPYLIGSIGVFSTYILIAVLLLLKEFCNLNINVIIIVVLNTIMLIFYTNSIYAIPFSYAGQIMTERGYSVAMIFYSITLFLLSLSFGMFLSLDYNMERVYIGYIIFFTVISALVIFQPP